MDKIVRKKERKKCIGCNEIMFGMKSNATKCRVCRREQERTSSKLSKKKKRHKEKVELIKEGIDNSELKKRIDKMEKEREEEKRVKEEKEFQESLNKPRKSAVKMIEESIKNMIPRIED